MSRPVAIPPPAVPAIATVFDPHPWEESLVAVARSTGLARVVRRCVDPAGVEGVLGDVDAVVIGADAPWLSVPLLARWSTRTTIVGVVAGPEDPMRRAFVRGGCLVVDRSTPAAALLAGIGLLDPPRQAPPPPGGKAVAVVGPRGAPGVSEIALGLACLAARTASTLLAELDHEAPSLGLRLGLSPTDGAATRTAGPLDILSAPLRPGALATAVTTELLAAGRRLFDVTVCDHGTDRPAETSHDGIVLVTETSPAALVRTARLLADWMGAPPLVVANRTRPDDEPAIRRLRAATGLEPAAVVPTVSDVVWGEPPPPTLLTHLEALAAVLDLSGVRSPAAGGVAEAAS